MPNVRLPNDPFAGAFPPPPPCPAERARRISPAALIRVMAAEMVAQSVRKGDCTERDLRMAGYTLAEIHKHGPAARQAALRQVGEVA